jgi:hypothetical protein
MTNILELARECGGEACDTSSGQKLVVLHESELTAFAARIRKVSKWFASKPGARRLAREAARRIEQERSGEK